MTCLKVVKSGCFLFGIAINILLLVLTIWTAVSGKAFAVWVSLLVCFLFVFVYQLTITLARIHDDNSADSYIVPLTDQDIEMLVYNSPRPARRENVDEVQQGRAWARYLAERPLPPVPARYPSVSTTRTVIPSPISDPFFNVVDGTRAPLSRRDGRTLRMVPESSVASRL